jgi:sirohydrochlorin ferrochelatase
VQVTSPPRLLIAAHGTESATGSATTAALVGAIAAAAREVPVSLCFLDVVGPSLADALGAADGPTVVVPLLLSTGYHVQSDIPAVVGDRPGVRIAAHLGPDPLIISALADRLGAAAAPSTTSAMTTASTVLVGVGSSRPEARPELESAGRQLAERLGRPVVAMTLFENVRSVLTAQPRPVAVATYLLAEGEFYTRLCAAADGLAPAAAPIGAHPDLVRLVLARYRAALVENGPRTVR